MDDTSADTPASASAVLPKSKAKKELEFRGVQRFVTIHTGTGDKKEPFMVPKSLICCHSPFFDAAFNGQFVEGETQWMVLEDVETEIFALLVRWLYEHRIWQGDNGKIAAVDLAKLWDLAGRCLMPQLQNQVIDKLGDPRKFALISKSPQQNPITTAQELVEYVNHTAGDETPLRRYCVRLLLSLFSTEKEFRRDIGTTSPNQFPSRVCMRSILGEGLATDVIKSLMASLGHHGLDIPIWNAKDYYVNESN